MILFSTVLICSSLLILIGKGLADPKCPSSEPKSDALRLKKELFCGYDFTSRPVKLRSDRVRVVVMFTPLYVSFDTDMNTYGLRADMQWVWKDEFLVWDPSKYGGVKNLIVENHEIWVPEIYQTSSSYWYQHDIGGWSSICTVNSDGWVNCSSDPSMYINCLIDLTHWPYDYQNCNVRIASIEQTEEKIELDIMDSGISTLFVPNHGWELLKMTTSKGSFGFAHRMANYIEYSMLFRREAPVLEATVIYPLIVLAILVLSSYWLGLEPEARMNLLCTVLICHTLVLLDIGFINNGFNAPLVVLFFRDSLLLNVFSLEIAVFVAWINTGPISKIPVVINYILESEAAQMILLFEKRKLPKGTMLLEEEQNEELEHETVSPVMKNWNNFSTLIDRIFFIVMFISYIVLIIKYIFLN